MGGGGGSLGKSESNSKANASQDVWGPQGGALQNLYGAAEQLWGGMGNQMNQISQGVRQANPYVQGAANSAMPAWQQQLSGGDTGQLGRDSMPGLRQSLQQSMNSPSNTQNMYRSIMGGEGNSYADPAINSMYGDAYRNFDRGFRRNNDASAIGTGNFNNSQRGIAEGVAMGDLNRDLMSRGSQMRYDAFDKDLGMKMDIAKLADQNIGAAQDRTINMLNQGDANRYNAIQGGAGMQNLGMGMLAPGMAQMQAPWQMMGQYSNTIGGPTVLSQGNQRGSSKGLGMSGYGYGGA